MVADQTDSSGRALAPHQSADEPDVERRNRQVSTATTRETSTAAARVPCTEASRVTIPKTDDTRRADLRAEIARDGRKLYQVAALAAIHPTYLGDMLAGRRALPDDVVERVLAVLRGQR